jgi:hypothetical protein
MKLTIVIDTEDPEGLRDTFKIVSHFIRKQTPSHLSSGRTVKYGKIPFIKMLRKFSLDVIQAEKDGQDGHGLRLAKSFADIQFHEQCTDSL